MTPTVRVPRACRDADETRRREDPAGETRGATRAVDQRREAGLRAAASANFNDPNNRVAAP